MSNFSPETYGPVIADLIGERRLNELGAGRPNQAWRAKLQAMSLDTLFAEKSVKDRDMANACLAGLWLLHNFLDESHTICQGIKTTTGSYWHGIIHRREPDYSNSKYWFRRVGEHPVFDPLCAVAGEIAGRETDVDDEATFLRTQRSWDPFAFVDLCEASVTGRSACEQLCWEIQQREWELLFDYGFQHAVDVS